MHLGSISRGTVILQIEIDQKFNIPSLPNDRLGFFANGTHYFPLAFVIPFSLSDYF
jgi:hypothetical protein